MTVTPLMWRSLDNFSKLFAYMPPFPLEWNVSKQKMVSRTNSKDLFFWKILMFWLFVAILVLLILPLAKIYGFAEIKFPTMMIIVLVGSADGLVELLELVTKSCAENAAVAFNLIVVLEKQIRKSNDVLVVTFCKLRRFYKIRSLCKLRRLTKHFKIYLFSTDISSIASKSKISKDIVGIALNVITYTFSIYAVIVPICGIYLKLDPFSLFETLIP